MRVSPKFKILTGKSKVKRDVICERFKNTQESVVHNLNIYIFITYVLKKYIPTLVVDLEGDRAMGLGMRLKEASSAS